MKINQSTIPGEDVHSNGSDTDDSAVDQLGPMSEAEAAEAFLRSWDDAGDKNQSSEDEETVEGNDDEKASDEQPDHNEEEDASKDDDDDPDSEDDEAEPALAQDDAMVSLKVGEEEVQVPVKDLKRLYGQESALTKRSQEVASERKAVAMKMEQFDQGLAQIHKMAQEQWSQYSNLDFMALSTEMDKGEFKQLFQDATNAKTHFDFVSKSHSQWLEARQSEQDAFYSKAIKETDVALSDQAGPHYIPDYNEGVRESLISFATENGVPAEAIARETSPAAFNILWKAQQYDKVKASATTIKAKPKVKATSKKTLTGEPGSSGKSKRSSEAMSRLKNTGSTDDAAAAFLAIM